MGVAVVVVYRINRPKHTQPVKYEKILQIFLEDSDDSDDDSNLSDMTLMKLRLVWTQVLDAFSTEISVYLENGTS